VKNLPGGFSIIVRTLNRDYISPDSTIWGRVALNVQPSENSAKSAESTLPSRQNVNQGGQSLGRS